jgi:hypothetical protein
VIHHHYRVTVRFRRALTDYELAMLHSRLLPYLAPGDDLRGQPMEAHMVAGVTNRQDNVGVVDVAVQTTGGATGAVCLVDNTINEVVGSAATTSVLVKPL